MTGQELTFLSDLHLGAGGPSDQFTDDAALVALLDDLAEASRRVPGVERRLVLLGDTVDLLVAGGAGGGPERALAALQRIVGAHTDVFAALRDVAHAGVTVDVVPGNHDIDLALPELARLLAAIVPGATVRPWIVHVPGLVFAEHGQQHHAINRFRGLARLATGTGGGVGVRPAASHIEAIAAEHRGAVPTALRLAAAAPAVALGLAAAGGTEGATGGHWELPERALRELDRVAAASARADRRRLARRAARRPRTPSFAAMLPGAAARTHAVLAAHGAAVPFLVFGHTHLAADVPIATPGPRTRYLNCGTWLPIGGSQLRTLVTVGRRASGRAFARLERWDPDARVRLAAA